MVCGLKKKLRKLVLKNMSNKQEKFEVNDERLKELLRNAGQQIKKDLPKDVGFTLLLFDYGEGGSLFYLSSATREDMVATMKEFIAKQEEPNVS